MKIQVLDPSTAVAQYYEIEKDATGQYALYMIPPCDEYITAFSLLQETGSIKLSVDLPSPQEAFLKLHKTLLNLEELGRAFLLPNCFIYTHDLSTPLKRSEDFVRVTVFPSLASQVVTKQLLLDAQSELLDTLQKRNQQISSSQLLKYVEWQTLKRERKKIISALQKQCQQKSQLTPDMLQAFNLSVINLMPATKDIIRTEMGTFTNCLKEVFARITSLVWDVPALGQVVDIFSKEPKFQFFHIFNPKSLKNEYYKLLKRVNVYNLIQLIIDSAPQGSQNLTIMLTDSDFVGGAKLSAAKLSEFQSVLMLKRAQIETLLNLCKSFKQVDCCIPVSTSADQQVHCVKLMTQETITLEKAKFVNMLETLKIDEKSHKQYLSSLMSAHSKNLLSAYHHQKINELNTQREQILKDAQESKKSLPNLNKMMADFQANVNKYELETLQILEPSLEASERALRGKYDKFATYKQEKLSELWDLLTQSEVVMRRK